jgi:hypothetical protein
MMLKIQQKQSFDSGAAAHESFKQLAISRGWSVKDSTPHQDMKHHIDVIATMDNLVCTFDIKARKKIARADESAQDDWLYVEFLNVRGDDGWLYGKANFIAFEQSDAFLIVHRRSLAKYCEAVVDRKIKVAAPHLCQYKSYTRKGRSDEISLIETKRIPPEITKYWIK